jgi:hypothetical protein
MRAKRINWVSKRCPVCGRVLDYIEAGYEPSTCNNFDCLHKWLHDPNYKQEREYDKRAGTTAQD